MLYAIIAEDGPNTLEQRLATRPHAPAPPATVT